MLELPISILTLFKTKCIWAKNDVTLFSQSNTRMMHWRTSHSRRFTFTNMILSVMLVPYGNSRSRILFIDSVRNKQYCRHPIIFFCSITYEFNSIAILIDYFFCFWLKGTRLGPRTTQTSN